MCTVQLIWCSNQLMQLIRRSLNLIIWYMKTKYILLLFLLFPLFAEAQENYFYISWNGNIPLSSTEYIDNTSGRGAKIGYRGYFGRYRRVSAGIDINWAQYDQYKPKETFDNETGAIKI